MKNIVIREKSRKMSREGYDARWNRRITLEGGQLFSYIYIYIKEDRLPRSGNRGSSCSCSKWMDASGMSKRDLLFASFIGFLGNWIIISSQNLEID